ncbi:hypothetical protein BGZ83_010644 [Gryganskiella cystojenkinii]|nr:hypothetical protein BGZ83_010644 [Gryganskiella cystojenkinii]
MDQYTVEEHEQALKQHRAARQALLNKEDEGIVYWEDWCKEEGYNQEEPTWESLLRFIHEWVVPAEQRINASVCEYPDATDNICGLETFVEPVLRIKANWTPPSQQQKPQHDEQQRRAQEQDIYQQQQQEPGQEQNQFHPQISRSVLVLPPMQAIQPTLISAPSTYSPWVPLLTPSSSFMEAIQAIESDAELNVDENEQPHVLQHTQNPTLIPSPPPTLFDAELQMQLLLESQSPSQAPQTWQQIIQPQPMPLPVLALALVEIPVPSPALSATSAISEVDDDPEDLDVTGALENFVTTSTTAYFDPPAHIIVESEDMPWTPAETMTPPITISDIESESDGDNDEDGAVGDQYVHMNPLGHNIAGFDFFSEVSPAAGGGNNAIACSNAGSDDDTCAAQSPGSEMIVASEAQTATTVTISSGSVEQEEVTVVNSIMNSFMGDKDPASIYLSLPAPPLSTITVSSTAASGRLSVTGTSRSASTTSQVLLSTDNHSRSSYSPTSPSTSLLTNVVMAAEPLSSSLEIATKLATTKPTQMSSVEFIGGSTASEIHRCEQEWGQFAEDDRFEEYEDEQEEPGDVNLLSFPQEPSTRTVYRIPTVSSSIEPKGLAPVTEEKIMQDMRESDQDSTKTDTKSHLRIALSSSPAWLSSHLVLTSPFTGWEEDHVHARTTRSYTVFKAEEFLITDPEFEDAPLPIDHHGTIDKNKVTTYSLSNKVRTVYDVLLEWRFGLSDDGLPSIQNLNQIFYPNRWWSPESLLKYKTRSIIVREYVYRVKELGLTSEVAIRSLEKLRGPLGLVHLAAEIRRTSQQRGEVKGDNKRKHGLEEREKGEVVEEKKESVAHVAPYEARAAIIKSFKRLVHAEGQRYDEVLLFLEETSRNLTLYDAIQVEREMAAAVAKKKESEGGGKRESKHQQVHFTSPTASYSGKGCIGSYGTTTIAVSVMSRCRGSDQNTAEGTGRASRLMNTIRNVVAKGSVGSKEEAAQVLEEWRQQLMLRLSLFVTS